MLSDWSFLPPSGDNLLPRLGIVDLEIVFSGSAGEFAIPSVIACL